MKDKVILDFLKRIKPLMPRIKTIYLFGSRVRGDYKPNSDYDLLIVTKEKDLELKDKLFDAVIDTLINTGRYISLKVYPLKEFNRLSSIPTLFMENILKEGVKIE